MSFVDDFDPKNSKKKGNMADDVSVPATYIDKQVECDMDVRVKCAKIFKSENPDHEGEERFVAELEVLEKRKGQADAKPGVVLSHFIDCSRNRKPSARQKSFEELIVTLAMLSDACKTGYTASQLQADPILIYKITEDEGAELQGAVFRLTTKKKSKKSDWYSLIYDILDAGDEAAAE